MNCANCQKPLQEGHKFCPYCGTPARQTCYSCGKEVQAEWVNCPHCGTSLKKPAGQPNIYPHTQPSHLGHYSGHYSDSSSGYHHRRKKSLLERFFS